MSAEQALPLMYVEILSFSGEKDRSLLLQNIFPSAMSKRSSQDDVT
jgi:hypothetical protein